MPVGVIIVAAGRGQRLGPSQPKQFVDLGGRSMLQRSIAAFDRHPEIAEIVVVLPAAFVASGPGLTGPTLRPCAIVAGGAARHDSVRCGLAALGADVDLVLIHDAARPFVAADLIDRVIAAAREDGAAVPAVAARDTVKRVDPASVPPLVAETVPRESIWLAQTPQAFRRDLVERATAAQADAVTAPTDEAMAVERIGHRVRVVQGDERNMKVTTARDLAIARAGLAAAPRVGTGYDLHRLVDGRPLVLAGVVVDAGRGPDGHSDGDVICHALVDAVLGAAGAGDIGRHFPNTDPRWKDAAGLDLLTRALAIVGERGWTLTSADVTVVLERPKLGPHVDAICGAIAAAAAMDRHAISVKAKTNEGVDAIGRGEAIAAHAVAVVTPAGS